VQTAYPGIENDFLHIKFYASCCGNYK